MQLIKTYIEVGMGSWIKLFISIVFISSCSIIDNFSNKKLNLTKDIIDSPYAMQVISINNKKEELFLLNEAKDSLYKWSRDKDLRLFTSNGKIVKSYGLDNDFELIYYKGIVNLEDNIALIRFRNPESDYLEINFSYSVIEKGVMRKEIDKSEFLYTLIEERFHAPLIGWKGSNFYWIDEDGYTWQSEQVIDPFGKTIKSRTLKKYSD